MDIHAVTFDKEIRWAHHNGAPKVFVPSDDSFRGTKHVYRFVSLVQCLDLFESSALVFSNPESWPDKYEGAWIKRLCSPNGTLRKSRAVRAVCFTQDPNTESFWRIYSRVSPVIRLRFKLDMLLDAGALFVADGAKTFAAPMRYVSEDEIDKSLRAISTSPPRDKSGEIARFLMHKRRAFRHEAEVRVVRIAAKSLDNTHRVEIDLTKTLDQIVIDPYADPWMSEAIRKSLTTRYGFKGVIERSNLDREPESDL